MSVVQPGSGKGSGQRPGSPGARKPAPPQGSRPGTKTPPRPGAKTPTRPGTKTPPRPGTKTPPKGRPGTPGGKAGARPGTKVSARPPRRFSPSTLAFVSVGLVVVVIAAFVLAKVVGGSSTPTTGQRGPIDTPASPAVVAQVTSVPTSVATTVGVSNLVSPPTVLKGQPLLTSNSRPAFLYIGAEYCPYCGAERWAIVMALSRFGSFSGLKETTSSPWDTDASTATFSFHGASYTSPYFQFDHVENVSNDTNGPGTRTTLEPLTAAQSALWAKYSARLGVSEGFPFLDFGNKVIVVGPSYDPVVLQGLGQSEIAAKLTNPQDPVTRAIVGTANYLTAAVCSLTAQQPSSVCSAPGVKKAASAMKLT